MKIFKRILLTFLTFFGVYFLLSMIENALKGNDILREVLIKTIVYSCTYLIATLIYTRKHDTLIIAILFFVGIVILFIPTITGVKVVNETTKDIMKDWIFWIRAIVMGIQFTIAKKHGSDYKEEKLIKQAQKENGLRKYKAKKCIQFEEQNKEGKITRRGKIKQR